MQGDNLHLIFHLIFTVVPYSLSERFSVQSVQSGLVVALSNGVCRIVQAGASWAVGHSASQSITGVWTKGYHSAKHAKMRKVPICQLVFIATRCLPTFYTNRTRNADRRQRGDREKPRGWGRNGERVRVLQTPSELAHSLTIRWWRIIIIRLLFNVQAYIERHGLSLPRLLLSHGMATEEAAEECFGMRWDRRRTTTKTLRSNDFGKRYLLACTHITIALRRHWRRVNSTTSTANDDHDHDQDRKTRVWRILGHF